MHLSPQKHRAFASHVLSVRHLAYVGQHRHELNLQERKWVTQPTLINMCYLDKLGHVIWAQLHYMYSIP